MRVGEDVGDLEAMDVTGGKINRGRHCGKQCSSS